MSSAKEQEVVDAIVFLLDKHKLSIPEKISILRVLISHYWR